MDSGLHKFPRAVIARMEIDCPNCMNRLRLNVHPLETAFSIFGLVAFVALALLAYRLQSEEVMLLALAAGVTGAAAAPVLGRTRLRDWPRYVAVTKKQGSER